MFGKNFITSDELREMRLNAHRIQHGGDFLIDDRLESEGTLKIFECIGGCLYLEPESLFLGKAPAMAGISICRSGNSLALKEIFCQYGNEWMIQLLMEQVKHFAGFYGYQMAFPDLGKDKKPCQ